MQALEFKSIPIETKDIDVGNRIIRGYFSVFGNIDSDNDIIAKGAYTRTISENGPKGNDRIAHLLHHDIRRPIGKIQTLEEDNHGLYFESQLSSTGEAVDVLNKYSEGIFKEHSVGFRTVEARDNEDGTRTITEIQLFEGSTVTLGANPLALVKGELNVSELKAEIETIEKFLKSGKPSNKNWALLEFEFRKLKAMIQEQESAEASPSISEDLSELYHQFTTKI